MRKLGNKLTYVGKTNCENGLRNFKDPNFFKCSETLVIDFKITCRILLK